MSTYTVNPTTYEVLKDGMPLVGSPFASNYAAIQAAFDDVPVNSEGVPTTSATVTLLSGVHTLNTPVDGPLFVKVGDIEREEWQGGYKILSLSKGITLQGEVVDGQNVTTLQGAHTGNDFIVVRGYIVYDFFGPGNNFNYSVKSSV